MCIALVSRNNFLKSWCNYGTYFPVSCETIAVLDISEARMSPKTSAQALGLIGCQRLKTQEDMPEHDFTRTNYNEQTIKMIK